MYVCGRLLPESALARPRPQALRHQRSESASSPTSALHKARRAPILNTKLGQVNSRRVSCSASLRSPVGLIQHESVRSSHQNGDRAAHIHYIRELHHLYRTPHTHTHTPQLVKLQLKTIEYSTPGKQPTNKHLAPAPTTP